MHFFLLFSAADVPTPWHLSLEMGEAGAHGLVSLAVLPGSWQGSSLSTQTPFFFLGGSGKPLSVEPCSLVSPSPSYQRVNLCVAVCLQLLDRAGPEDNTREIIPAY